MTEGFVIPNNFSQRRRCMLEQGCSFHEGVWTEKTTDDYSKGKRVVLSLPGAFTPTLYK